MREINHWHAEPTVGCFFIVGASAERLVPHFFFFFIDTTPTPIAGFFQLIQQIAREGKGKWNNTTKALYHSKVSSTFIH